MNLRGLVARSELSALYYMMDVLVGRGFTEFFESAEPRLRRALSSEYGADVGSEASADALAWGWQNWGRIKSIANPVGYLYRVGQTSARRQMSRRRVPFHAGEPERAVLPDVDPAVGATLASMPQRQRVAVTLVHGYGYRHREVAELLECSPSTVANHVRRGMTKLRDALGVSDND